MIQVGFSHATGFWVFLSKAIMAITGRPYSHCWLLCTGADGIRGVDVVLTEDENGGLHFVPWAGYSTGKTIVAVLNSPYDLGPGLVALLQVLGTGYDFTGLVGEGWVLAMQAWFKRKVANPLAIASRMWCSEAIYYGMEHTPQFGIPPGTSDQVVPGLVYDAILQAGGTLDPAYGQTG
jgi:hypothetical protein